MIYICIPTHNEQQTVGVVLWKLRQVLTDFPRDYQLLVADDASTDKTPEVLEPYTRVLPLTVIRSEERKGCAASLEMLLREAVRRAEYPKRDVIVTLQADFSEEPDDLVPLVKRLEAGADVAVGHKVSSSKETRARRFARSLARFFMRRQKWPEGVMTPFDGYRAYRLYAVKRAIEDRGTGRLIRHEGWAGHAELLKAVLPHARRVDVVDIDDRPDRLQRPRREKPFAAAMQVRLLASGAEPQGLTGVEELDRIALTASRSRERAAITPQTIQAGRATASRGNGSRTRQPTGRGEQGRSRSQGNGAGRTRSAAAEARPRRDRSQQAEGRPRRKSAAQARTSQDEARRRQPRAEEPGAVPDEAIQAVDTGAAGSVAPDAATRPKRKRRRRKRGGQGSGSETARDQSAPSGAPDPADSETAAGGEAAAEASGEAAAEASGQAAVEASGQAAAAAGGLQARKPRAGQARAEGPAGAAVSPESSGGTPDADPAEGEAPKKRRRRGGRRGGRGRRKPRPEGAVEGTAESGGSEGTGNASSTAVNSSAAGGAAAEPAAREEND